MAFPQPNATDLPSLFSYANTVTSNWFWPLMLLAVYIVVYMTFSTRVDSRKAFATTGFFTGIIAAFMFVLSLINELTMIIAMVMALAGFLMLLFSESSPY